MSKTDWEFDPTVKNWDKPHRARIVKVCDNCGLMYYPRANGYELISKYCSQECYRAKRWPKSTANRPR